MAGHRFCTYFDSRYLDKGLCLHESLRRHVPGAELWILCLDKDVKKTLDRMRLPGVHTLSLKQLGQADPELLECKKSRRLVEYYFTCTPCLVRHLLFAEPRAEWVTYLDADLFFFRPPTPIFEEMKQAEVAIIPHRFSEAQRELEIYGKYNVGWVSFRHTPGGQHCAEWWRARCLEWCRDVPEDGKFADQKYLDHFHEVTPSTVSIRHPGANLAPWNLANHTLSDSTTGVKVDGKDLIFFHFHDCKPVQLRIFNPGLAKYGVPITSLMKTRIYQPYLRKILGKRRLGGGSSMRFEGTDVAAEKVSVENLIEVPLTRWDKILGWFRSFKISRGAKSQP